MIRAGSVVLALFEGDHWLAGSLALDELLLPDGMLRTLTPTGSAGSST